MEAIRYGDRPEVRARLNQVVDNAMDRNKLRDLIEEHALAHDSMDASRVREIREDMERADARRLQPHFVAAFFNESFKRLGSTLREREPKRYEATHVPAVIRNRDRIIGMRDPDLTRYERLSFEKELISYAVRNLVPSHLQEIKGRKEQLVDKTMAAVKERLTT
jgi:hypothetical protein